MDYTEIGLWIKQNILKNTFTLNFLCKNEKIFDEEYIQNNLDLSSLNKSLNSIGKKLKKTKNDDISWCKINLIDNAITDLVGIGKISDFKDLNIFSYLLTLDKAEQNGDTVICIFDETKKWIIKIVNCSDEERIYIRTYGKGKIVELLKL